MTDQELRDLVAGLTVKHAELAQALQRSKEETDRVLLRSKEETDRAFLESRREEEERRRKNDESRRELDQMVKELGRQIGGLGDKFGSFTEGMAFPSMSKILTQRFHMDFIAPRVVRCKGGRTMEVDVMAYSNSGANEVFLVEIKSHLRKEALEQIRKLLRDFRDFFPEHADKKVYGMLASVDVPDNVRKKILDAGIYLAQIHDGQFEVQVPDDFQPRAY